MTKNWFSSVFRGWCDELWISRRSLGLEAWTISPWKCRKFIFSSFRTKLGSKIFYSWKFYFFFHAKGDQRKKNLTNFFFFCKVGQNYVKLIIHNFLRIFPRSDFPTQPPMRERMRVEENVLLPPHPLDGPRAYSSKNPSMSESALKKECKGGLGRGDSTTSDKPIFTHRFQSSVDSV